jgi:hypothetical protein
LDSEWLKSFITHSKGRVAHAARLAPRQSRHLTIKFLRQPCIVRIQERDVPAGALLYATIPRNGNAAVLLTDVSRRRTEPRYHRFRLIGGAIVNDHHFDIVKGLGQYAIDGIADVLGSVVRGYYYRNGWHT